MTTDQPAASPTIYQRFAGKSVLITGDGTGFPREIAFRAVQEGARYDRSEEGARRTAERIESNGGEAFVVKADIGTWDAIKHLAKATFSHFGTLDVLVNTVGDVATEQVSWTELTRGRWTG